MAKREREKVKVVDKRESIMFIHSAIDDYGLSVSAFRIYARLARRAGSNGTAYESVANMAEACRMSERQCRYALKELKDHHLIQAEQRAGETTVYTLTSTHTWVKKTNGDLCNICRGAISAHGVCNICRGTPAISAAEVNPLEVNPLKENTNTSTSLTSASFDDYLEAWNNNRGPLRKATKLNQWRKQKIKAHHRENKHEALHMFTIATQQVANNDYWIEQGFGLDNLLRNKILHYYEQAQTTNNQPTRPKILDYDPLDPNWKWE